MLGIRRHYEPYCGATDIGEQQLMLNWPLQLLFRLHYIRKRTKTLLTFSARSKRD